MAAAKIGYRGNAIGISAGLGIALPLAAYAATLPFDGVNDAVRTDALPFAAGIVAGVGMLALTGHLIDRHAERVAEDEAEAARFASLYDGSSTRADSAQTMTKGAAPRGKRFARGGAPAGVPVISRAVDALDEMEAWAEIDAMFNEDSPISCDPARSKDMYQIALEELLKAERAAAQTQSAPQADVASTGSSAYAGDADEANARNEAMAALYGDAVVQRSYAPVLPNMPAASAPTPAVAVQAASSADRTNAASAQVQSGSAVSEMSAASREDPVSVPVADYSGHEGMWAAALAILQELEPSMAAPGPHAAHVASAAAEASPAVDASHIDARRMAAIAEGNRATREHSHVNELIEEEFNRVPSKSVHHTAHEYLKVIEGGTAAMPSLQTAEA